MDVSEATSPSSRDKVLAKHSKFLRDQPFDPSANSTVAFVPKNNGPRPTASTPLLSLKQLRNEQQANGAIVCRSISAAGRLAGSIHAIVQDHMDHVCRVQLKFFSPDDVSPTVALPEGSHMYILNPTLFFTKKGVPILKLKGPKSIYAIHPKQPVPADLSALSSVPVVSALLSMIAHDKNVAPTSSSSSSHNGKTPASAPYSSSTSPTSYSSTSVPKPSAPTSSASSSSSYSSQPSSASLKPPPVSAPYTPPPMSEAAIEKKDEGNAFYSAHKYPEALKSYTAGLRIDPESVILLSNRAACYIMLAKPEKALMDSQSGLYLDPAHPKCGFRRVRSLALLGRFQEAEPLARDLLSRHPVDENKEILDITVRGLRELAGNYDLVAMHDEEMKSGARLLAHGEYISPHINISPSRSQVDFDGLDDFLAPPPVAIRDIKAGTLLIVTKAISSSFINDVPKPNMPETILKDLRAQMVANSDIARQICTMSQDLPPSTDMQYRLKHVLINKLVYKLDTMSSPPLLKRDAITKTGAGLWPISGRLPRACVANCDCFFAGDFMFVHAIRDIRQGNVLTLTTPAYDMSYKEAQKYYQGANNLFGSSSSGFKAMQPCTCVRCSFFAANPGLVEKEQVIHEKFYRNVSDHSMLESLWRQAFDIFPLASAHEHHVAIHIPLSLMWGEHLDSKKQYQHALDVYQRGVEYADIVYGPGHPLATRMMANMALTKDSMSSNPAEGRAQAARAFLAFKTRFSGLPDSDIFINRLHMGQLLRPLLEKGLQQMGPR
eukprot:TRINITY_DN6227_c1_g1_i2.p1 TRINITY_DN6227_c1_g1~~TRINITY_DN6227_c1_g1_i2.p1  ORF type:complete len:777 (-),score=175.59 TRINITY_DN6227_c1_g1_i2:61-2391(-)